MINTLHSHRRIAILALVASSGCALIAIAGCALNVNLGANRFDSPETAGSALHGSIDTALAGSNTLIFSPDSPTWDRSNASLRLTGSLGLLDRLDVAIKTSWNGPVLLQAKVQILGAPLARAQSRNFAVAATFAVGATQPSGENLDAYDAALVAGYRVAETWMIYAGPFVTATRYSDTLGTQEHSLQSGANLGLQLDSVLGALKIEEAWTLTTASGIQQTGFYTGACLSYRF